MRQEVIVRYIIFDIVGKRVYFVGVTHAVLTNEEEFAKQIMFEQVKPVSYPCN